METISSLKYSASVKKLRMQKYKVIPIKRKGGWVPETHDSAFMNEGAKMGVVVPVLPGNILVEPLRYEDGERWSNEDRKALADELGLEGPEQFNVHAAKNYWRGNTVDVDRRGHYLDCSKVEDFIKYLILISDSDRISPNWAKRFEKGTYKFAIIGEGQEIEENVTRTEDMKKAYTLFGRMDSSAEKMKDFLFVYYLQRKEAKRPPRDAGVDWLKAEIQKVVDTDLTMFLEINSDEKYDTKLLIIKSVESGALKRERHQYFIPGDEKPIGTIDQMIAFLDDDRNQEVKMKMLVHVDNTQKK